MTQRLKQLLLSVIMLMGVVLAPAANAEGIKVKFFELERIEAEWFLNAAFQIELSPGLEDAIQKGVVLHFQTEFELTRSRWYWFDERPVLALRQTRLSYQPLTKQFRIASGGLTFTAQTIAEALQVVGSIGGWRVIDGPGVDPSKPYSAALRMSLDLSKLPKPFQVNALNNKTWNVSSDWTRFMFTPDAQTVLKRQE
jgi:Domain of unknown function (DUF4390)